MLHFSILLYPDELQKSIYQQEIGIDFCNLLHFSIPQSYYILQKQRLFRILIVLLVKKQPFLINIRNPLIYCVNRYCLRSASVGAKALSWV